MEILLIQPNPTCGAFAQNAARIADLARQTLTGYAGGAREILLLCPEAACAGLPWQEPSQIETFFERSLQGLELLARLLKDLPCPANLRLLLQIPAAAGVQLALLQQGRVETLNLEADGLLELPGLRLYLPELHLVDENGLSNADLALLPAPAQADLVLVQNAWLFREQEAQEQEAHWADLAARWGKPLVAVNCCGGNDGLIFAGQSCVFDAVGNLRGRAKAFAEDALLFNPAALDPLRLEPMPGPEEALFRAMTLGIRDYVQKCGLSQVLLGLSGGMDSALVACLAVAALGADKVLALRMPAAWSTEHSLADAELLAANLGIRTVTIPIAPVLDAFNQALTPGFANLPAVPGDLTQENLQARIRGVMLMAHANRLGAIVLGTSNKSETAVGYCTLYGDTVGSINPLGDVFKTRVYEIARWYNHSQGREVIPAHILDKPPSAELKPGQKDEDTLPPYPVLDAILRELLGKGADPASLKLPGVNQESIDQVARLVARAEFKRHQSPEIVALSDSVFGLDWRMPIASRIWQTDNHQLNKAKN